MANEHNPASSAAPTTDVVASPEDTHRLIKARIDKADKLRAAGLDPYANDFKPELSTRDVRDRYDSFDAAQLEKVSTLHTIAGRVVAMRQMGKASFLTLRDAFGELQIYVKQDRVGETSYQFLKLTDLGDFVGVAGTPMRTRAGELTLAADGFRVLTKALRPLPDKFHGLHDVEARYRQRYLDLVVNMDARRVFRTRARVVRTIQHFLDDRGFIEVETPTLQDVAGGATAKPFVTHHNALSQDFFLRIATELHLKRLVVGGLERVYEIGKNFRNEGVSTRHNPEFTSIEVYQAYATYTDMMDLTEAVVTKLVEDLHGRMSIPFGERDVNFQSPWRRAPIAQLVGEHLGVSEDLRGIDSVEKALGYAVGHTAQADEPLHVCLRELSDDEAERIIPGIATDARSIVERAKEARRNGGAAFYQQLGRAIDEAFMSTGVVPGAPIANDEVTMPAVPVPPNLFAEETGEFTLPRLVDHQRARRRNIALCLLYSVFDHEVERTLTNPTFITDFPLGVSPLARKRDGDPAVTDRFELIVAGMELANAFSELNDPLDQRRRFEQQMREKARGDDEASELDEDFCRALEVGMPPTAGLGIGIDRLVMVLTNQQSIRDVILFPAMRRVAHT